MTKSELEKKHLSDLHQLAAEAGVEKFRLLSKSELVERLAEGNGDAGNGAPPAAAKSDAPKAEAAPEGEERERPARRRRRRRTGSPAVSDEIQLGEQEDKPAPAPASEPEPAAEGARPRRRRRRRFGRRSKAVTLQTLLLPPEAGRQALVFAESREGCTALLRGVAADLSADTKGPDPVALLIDPSPEELADWKRDAPQAEIVSAGQPRHASDALAQAAARAGKGEDVILLVDSLTRLAEATGDAESAKEFFDAGREQGSQGGGSLTVVAALERPNGD
ncbi:MAG TPA: Rho termination factor N-terminal domain-containing protein [Solirubrobacterales bacterium]|nr:Rho termination factor N-terminal domain-containing protein [Solirubrobacterales bacterium]